MPRYGAAACLARLLFLACRLRVMVRRAMPARRYGAPRCRVALLRRPLPAYGTSAPRSARCARCCYTFVVYAPARRVVTPRRYDVDDNIRVRTHYRYAI